MKIRNVAIVAALAVAVWLTSAWGLETAWLGETPVAAGRAMVVFSPEVDRAAAVTELAAAGFAVAHVSTIEGVTMAPERWLAKAEDAPARYVEVAFDPTADVAAALARLRAVPGVAEAWPDQIMTAAFVPNDPLYSAYQQYLPQINIEKAWDRTQGKDVTVAVVDTGYAGSLLTDGAVYVLDGYDFADNDTNPMDTEGHGSHVSNVICHATDNGRGAAGAAPDAYLLPCKVFEDGEDGARESDIITAVDWAVEQGAQVINMSLGGSDASSVSARTMSDAYDAGVVLVAASGNESRDRISYPAGYGGVIAVGSCDTHAIGSWPVRSSFSNFGDGLDLVAPGDSIIAESNFGGQVGFYQAGGTSVASPHVAAAAALLIAALGGTYTPAQIEQALTTTAMKEDAGWDPELGYGEIDVYAAMSSLVGANPNQSPTAGILATPQSGPAPLEVQFTAGAADPDGQVKTYLWSFSSGETYNGLTFTHTFEDAGIYKVYLTVTDDDGASDTTFVTIEVGEKEQDSEEDKGGGCMVAPAGGGGGAASLALFLASLTLAWKLRRGGSSVAFGHHPRLAETERNRGFSS